MISLNYRDQRPIYEQVKDGLRHLVVTGAIQSSSATSVMVVGCLNAGLLKRGRAG